MAGSDAFSAIVAQRGAFKSFLASRLGSEADAEDVLQQGLVKAVERAGDIADGQKAVAWFYQVLRNALVDHVRSRSAAARRDDAWAKEVVTLAEGAEAEAEATRQLCACFEKLLPTLKPAQAELLRRVELKDEPVGKVAQELGMTANHASVTLHRARAELRKRLVDFCGDCSCLEDCGCD